MKPRQLSDPASFGETLLREFLVNGWGSLSVLSQQVVR